MNGKIPLVRLFVFSLIIAMSFVLLGGDAPGQVKDKEGKKEKALRVLKISGAAQTYLDALLEGIKQSPLPFEDKELYYKYATSDSIMDYFIPVYMEKYTEDELDAMIDFYSSPAGQSIVRKSLTVVTELRKASMQWGRQISEKVNSEKAANTAAKDK